MYLKKKTKLVAMEMIMMSQKMMTSRKLQAARADVLVRNKDLVSIQMFSK
jgi:hypothetical protein